MLLLGLPDEDGARLPLKTKATASAARMRLARLQPMAEAACHLDEVWAALVGTQQLGAKAPEAVNTGEPNAHLLLLQT